VADFSRLKVAKVFRMIKFYTNRELSRIFSTNLAKWKRWSREFLPPDPLGGLQSGYARQYNLDEAFTVFLGGHLVGDLKFTIPESRQILNDLKQWLLDHEFYFDFSENANSLNESVQHVQNYQIAVMCTNIPDTADSSLAYRVKATITSETVNYNGVSMRQERYVESSIGAQMHAPELYAKSCRIINISFLRQSFLDYFKSDPVE
jgi:hypothetical protein